MQSKIFLNQSKIEFQMSTKQIGCLKNKKSQKIF